jgi:hypothetical protein
MRKSVLALSIVVIAVAAFASTALANVKSLTGTFCDKGSTVTLVAPNPASFWKFGWHYENGHLKYGLYFDQHAYDQAKQSYEHQSWQVQHDLYTGDATVGACVSTPAASPRYIAAVSNDNVCTAGIYGTPESLSADEILRQEEVYGTVFTNPFAVLGNDPLGDNYGPYRIVCTIPAGMHETGKWIGQLGDDTNPITASQTLGFAEIVS